MGPNRWRDEKQWPLARTDWQRYYLHSRGRANSADGDGALATQAPGHEPSDSFLYNPLDPAPTRGGGLCCYARGSARRRIRPERDRDPLRRAGLYHRSR